VTKLYAALGGDAVLPTAKREIDGITAPYHLFGDSAFALKFWMIKSYIFSDKAPKGLTIIQ